MQRCDRCQHRLPTESFALMDYCAECAKNLCDSCMKNGCCGHKPARSGMKEDGLDEDE